MARTAPIPNIPAIPGMNPGVWIMGGGGSGGGSGAGGGKGNAGDQGANGENGGNDPNGGGKDAANCGKGSSGGCPIHSPQLKAGDPVDVATGRVETLPARDVALPGPLPLEIHRRYCTHALGRDVGLGLGWSHSYGYELFLRQRTVEIWDDGGTMLLADIPDVGGKVMVRGRVLRREHGGFYLDIDGISFHFGEIQDNGQRHRLSSVEDRNGNRITLRYDAGNLVEIVDSVGRSLHVRATADGHIAAFTMKNAVAQGRWIDFAAYAYDDRGRLIRHTDAAGYDTVYRYDDDDRLTAYTGPDGLTFHFVYDDRGRCVETWGEGADGEVPGLSADVPATLADGHPAKGIHHVHITYADDYREVADSKEVRRLDCDARGNVLKAAVRGGVISRTLDHNGFLIEQVDALGAVTRYTRDADGNALTMTDALGYRTAYTYDSMGLLIEASDDVGLIVRVERDARGNMIRLEQGGGEITHFEYDARGSITRILEPNGGERRFEYDAEANAVRTVEPNGDAWHYRYDAFGNCTSRRDPLGFETRIAFDDRNLPTARYHANGSIARFRHDGRGSLVELVTTDGERILYEHLLGRLRRVTYANGATREYRYDREAFLVESVDENGEIRKATRSADGMPTELAGADGRTQRFAYDGMNRLVAYEDGNGRKTAFERDLRGQIKKVTYPDGTEATFEVDARGRMLAARNDAVELRYELDGGDQLVREVQIVDGVRHEVEHAYDRMRERVRLATSLGHEHVIERDLNGRPKASILDKTDRVEQVIDAIERETERRLPGGAVLHTTYGLDGLPVRRYLIGAGAAAGARRAGAEPAWIGPLPVPAVVDKAYEYSPGLTRIMKRWDATFGDMTYEYDSVDQLVSVSRGGRTVEAFTYDPAGNVFARGGTRQYRAGNRLESSDATRYTWDTDGRLIERVERAPDGSTRSWRYAYNGAGLLAEVQTPDDRTVTFAYDPFARRVRKDVARADKTGKPKREASSRFVWEKDRIVHEIRTRADDAGDPIVEERTYFYDEQYGDPLAERCDVITKAGRADGPMLFHVNDPLGTPEHLVRGDGQVEGALDRTAWGQVTSGAGQATTKIRFQGQFADDETGLHYNRYRYYDPEIGRFITPDPSGVIPDPNLYRYATNPVAWTDPLGLEHRATATFTPQGGQPVAMGGGKTYRSKYNAESDNYSRQYNKDNNLHPMGNFAKTDGNGVLVHRTSDTEAQILRDLDKMREGGMDLKGGHLQIQGELPPCSGCNKKMQDFAAKHGCTIQYKDSAGTAFNYP